MTTTAILFGSIGVIAETSNVQRQAYNQALKEAGLDWQWDEETYSDLLEMSGGRDRLGMLGRATGQPLSETAIAKIHTRKTELASTVIRQAGKLRPGVAALAQYAKSQSIALGFVTSTYQPNIDAILGAEGVELSAHDFDVIVTRDDVTLGKPAPDPYTHALGKLGIEASNALVIEDTTASIASARRAGIEVIATPGALTAEQDFHEASLVLPSLADAAGALHPQVTKMIRGEAHLQLHAVN